MYVRHKLIYFLLLTNLLGIVGSGCRSKISFPEFDSPAWKNDSYACQGTRREMLTGLKKIRWNLRGLTTTELMEVLGKPDSEALLASNERIYYYYLLPGTQCQNKRELSSANKLLIRFNALEQVSEVSFEQPVP